MRFARKRGTVLGGVLVTALLGLSLTACGGDDKKSANGLEKTELNVGSMAITEAASIQIAIDKGFFKAEGLTVHQKIVTGAAQGLPMLKSGALDITQGGHVGSIAAEASGTYDLKIIAEASQMTKNLNGILVAKDSPIKTPADLAGKKIGTNARGDQTSLLTRATVQPYGVKIDEQKNVVVQPFPADQQLLKSGQVDAIVVPEPFISQAQQQIGARLLTDFSEGPTKDFPITGYVTSAKFAKENPKTVAAFQRAFFKAQAIAGDRAVLQEALPKYTKLDPKVISTIALPAYPTSISATRLQRVADVMLQFGYLKKKFDVKSMVVENNG